MSDRSVTTDALETLGSIIDEAQKRDAIHIAVEPVVAMMRLAPGQDVGADGTTANPVGIVDPFLTKLVNPGDRFWLLIYPRKINSLRHVWSHPAFPDEEPMAHKTVDSTASRDLSERWLREFCGSADCPDYDTVLAAATGQPLPDVEHYGSAYSNDGEYLHFNGLDAHSEIPPEFWTHVEVVAGKRIPANLKASYFGCSC